ncbi:MAG: ribbon-helix-helix protein, CopG family [Deltaproteobacteria bacterium]|nr:ribbon-helix-helix protein, CopG family [Deltaproteobacteria bacterium]MBW1737064.1 ribbon-helix-helix protein, CopG family [Deltaproteobacteria bacterium]MBW1908972.1 ribbon-helix-helix protein, CopG family [Deltaproteobacteria bacterium]MBW2033875.1 ribbon-helix-helix protein, CopG family [Deltaproteobacteria bacterium]MBW2114387.1 ribbon-helix-helix protein, CopG family [Deltaproteobacteria bacterium]
MDAKTSSSIKVKVTASLDAGLVKAIDDFVKKSETRSRSQLIEDALRRWHKEQKMRELESQIEEYYVSLSDEEREENQEWSKISTQSAHQLWDE